MTTPLTDVLWVEKYRPTTLEQVALEEPNRKVLASYIQAEEIPHLFFVGPAGSGKTTVARILMAALDCQVMALNASAERGIDVVRDKIGNFVTAAFGARWNIVFLDEADALTSDAQTALRNLIETYAERSRFILTANQEHKVINPIQSRCQKLVLAPPPLKERFRILQSVLQAEGIVADIPTTLSYAERYPDMRKMLMGAQRAYLASGNGALPPAMHLDKSGGGQILELIDKHNWTGLRHVVASGDFDPGQGLRNLFYAIPDTHPKVGPLRIIIGKAVHESGFTPDPVILFLATCAECMNA